MDGRFDDYTASTLPINHYFNGTGLLVRDINQSLNLTVYSCFLNLNIGGLYRITSTNGILTILHPIKFEIRGGDERQEELIVQEGVNDDFIITITREVNTNLTFAVSLMLESIKGNLTGKIGI